MSLKGGNLTGCSQPTCHEYSNIQRMPQSLEMGIYFRIEGTVGTPKIDLNIGKVKTHGVSPLTILTAMAIASAAVLMPCDAVMKTVLARIP